MDFNRVLTALRRRWWILVLAIVLGGAAGFGVTTLQTPEYTATTRLFVSTTGGTSSTESYSGEQFSQQRTSSYAQIITSELITQRVVNDLNLPISAKVLSTRVTATVVPRTVLLEVSVVDTSAQRAADIANALSAKFGEFVGPLETPVGQEQPRSSIAVVKAAEAPSTPTSPQLRTNLFYGVLGGITIGFLAIVASALLARRIHSTRELKTLTNTTVLGPITSTARSPEQWRALLDTKHVGDAEADEIRRIRVQIEARNSPPKVLLLASASDRTQASDVGLNLSASFAEAGQRTALVCADPRAASLLLDIGLRTDGTGLSDLLADRASTQDVLVATARPTLVVVPPGKLADVESMLSAPAMSRLVEFLRTEFQRVVIVTAPVHRNSGASVLSALVDATVLVVDARSARRADVQTATNELRASRANVLGALLMNL